MPTVKKMYGMLESGLVIDGVIALTTRVTSQLRTVAMLTALSCMISLIYSQVIGPDENSKAAMKLRMQMTVTLSH